MKSEEIAYHFPDVRKTIKIGSGAAKETDDILLIKREAAQHG